MSKITLLTGGTAGIGRAIALKILKESRSSDHLIVVYGHDEQAAEKLRRDAPVDLRRNLHLIRSDLSRFESLGDLTREVKEITEKIDWLILNAGVTSKIPFDQIGCEEWERVMRTNVSVPAMLVRDMKPLMAEGGSILFLGSLAGKVPYSSSAVYGVSKAAVLFLARALVKEFEHKRVTVNSVAPGFIETGWQDGRTEESRGLIEQKIAAHRFGTPEEVAELCCFILSNPYLNGSVYEIHGGYGYF
ncbi:MAG: SDR family NAD(P)-dependent oxidoreductase [Anaerovoracaceae bacterium]|jgi:3-oxoacyl-[acyl-carrier protein] reductase